MRRGCDALEVLARILEDDVRHLDGSFGLHPGDYVGVLAERECRVLMSEALADYLRWNAGSQRDRGVGVAKVV